MNRLIAATLFAVLAGALAACGDSGDHFGEFKQNTNNGGGVPTSSPTGTATPSGSPSSSPTTSPSNGPAGVSDIVVTLEPSASPNPNQPGTYPLVITLYDGQGNVIPEGTPLSSNIVVTSNATCAIAFALPNQAPSTTFYTSVEINEAPGSGIVMSYTAGCATQDVDVSVNLQSNAIAPGTLSVFGGSATVTGISLSMIAAPNGTSSGVYPFLVSLTGTVGGGAAAALPTNESLATPVTLSSNNSCILGFGTTPAITIGPSTAGLVITSTSTLVYLYVNPGNATPQCPSTANVVITGSASGGAVTDTYDFTNAVPVASVHRKFGH